MDSYEVFESPDAPPQYLSDFVEDTRLLSAIENGIEGFTSNYLYVRQNGSDVFVVPIFYIRFKFSTLLNFPWLKFLTRDFGVKVACLGTPLSCYGRYEGELTPRVVGEVFQYLSKKVGLVGCKGFPIDPSFRGFTKARSMPVALLNFTSEKWAALKQTRNIRRKLKAAEGLVFSHRQQLSAEEIDVVYRLYCNTYDRSPFQFGRVSKGFFEKSNADSVFVLVQWEGRIVAFAQLFTKGSAACTTFAGIDYSVNPKKGLYFAIYFAIMQYLEESKINQIEFGETCYEFKRRIGCEIHDCWFFYKHRNPVLNFLLAKFKFLVEPAEPDLR